MDVLTTPVALCRKEATTKSTYTSLSDAILSSEALPGSSHYQTQKPWAGLQSAKPSKVLIANARNNSFSGFILRRGRAKHRNISSWFANVEIHELLLLHLLKKKMQRWEKLWGRFLTLGNELLFQFTLEEVCSRAAEQQHFKQLSTALWKW